MSQTFRCDPAALVAYLYDDIDPAERDAVVAHVERCEACALEVATLGTTRVQLATWTPPELSSNFRLEPGAATVNGPGPTGLRLVPTAAGAVATQPEGAPRWWRQPLPAWAQAVAASVIFAAGLALGATRGTQPPQVDVARAPAAPPQAAASVTAEDLARVERALRGEIAGVRSAATQRVSAPASSPDLRRVEALIAESEERQRRELAMRTVQMIRDFDLQRQADLVRVQQALGQFQGTTGAEVRQHRDAIEDLARRVSQTGR